MTTGLPRPMIVPEGYAVPGDIVPRQSADTSVTGVEIASPPNPSPLVDPIKSSQPPGVEGDRFAAAGGLTLRAPPDAPKPQPSSYDEIFHSMLRQTDVASALDYLSKPAFKPDPTYNPINDPQVKGSIYEQYYLDNFAASGSAAESGDIIRRINKELGDSSVLARGGWAGTAASFASGILSPFMLVPVGGEINALASAGKAVNILARAGKTAALVGAAVAGQEAVLQSTQETRTAAETVFAITGSTLLGGVLGAAAAGLSRGHVDALGAGLRIPGSDAEAAAIFHESLGHAGVGAQIADEMGAGVVKDPMLQKAIAFQDPLSRTMSSPFREARNANRLLNEIPVQLEDNALGVATSPGASAEYLAHEYDYALADAMGGLDRGFSQYRFGNPEAPLTRLRSGFADLTGQAQGKLGFSEFKQAVFDAMYGGDVHPIPEVAAVAREIRAKVEDPLKLEAIKVGLFPEDIKPGDDVSHVFRVYDTKAIAADREGFIAKLVADFSKRQESATHVVEGLGKRVEEKQFEITQAQQNIEQEFARYRQRQDELRFQAKVAGGEQSAVGAALKASTGAYAKEQRGASRAQAALYRGLLADVKRGRPSGKVQDINDFIRGRGGFRLARLDALGKEKFTTAYGAEIRDALGGKGKGRGIISPKGQEPDMMLRAAVEEGFLKPGADLNDLVSAIDDTLKGNPHFSAFDEAAVKSSADIKALAAEFDRMGVDVTKLPPDEFAKLMGAPAHAESPAMSRIAADIADLADRFDHATLKVADIERVVADLHDLAPELAATAKASKEASRASGKELRILQRQVGDLQQFTDMGPADIRSLAEETTNTILGFSPERALLPADLKAGPRGPLKERLLRIKTSEVRDYVVRDVAAVQRMMVRTMATDIALIKKFGSLDLSSEIAKINDEAAAMVREKPSSSAKVTAAQKVAIRDLQAMVDRMRGLYGIPKNPDGLLHRAVRVTLAWNLLAKLGNVVVSSIADVGKPVMNYGLNRVMATAFHPLVRGTSTIKLAMKEARLANAALDNSNHARQMSINDIMDNYGRGSRFEKGVQWASDRFGSYSLMDMWNQFHKEFAGTVAQTNMLRAIERAAVGKATTKEIAFLAADSIDANLIEKIGQQFAQHGVKDGEVWWAATEHWTDPEAVRAMRAALHREINRTIVTPGQDKPLWMSTELGRVIGQFHSFNIASVQRTVMAGLQQRDAAALNGMMLMLGLGYLSWYLKGQIIRISNPSAPDPGQESYETAALNAFDASGLAGWIMDANNVATKMTGGAFSVQRLMGAKEPSKYAAMDMMSMLGPTATTAEAIASIARAVGDGKWTQSTTHKVRGLIPLQNLFYLRWLFTKAEQGINNAFGIRKAA